MIIINDIKVTTDPTRKTAMSPLPLRSIKPITSRDSPSVFAAERSRRCVPVDIIRQREETIKVSTWVHKDCFISTHSSIYLADSPNCPVSLVLVL